MGLFNRKPQTSIETRSGDPLIDIVAAAIAADSPNGAFSATGVVANAKTVPGIPAVSRAISMISNDVAKQPLQVLDTSDSQDLLAKDSWQFGLLGIRPNSEISAVEFWRNATASLVGYGNLFIEKVFGVGRFRSQVVELHLLDPTAIQVQRTKQGELQYKYGTGTWTNKSNIIHIRNMSYCPSDLLAPSPIAVFRDTFSHYLAANRYMDTFYKNNATPTGVITFPEGMNETQTREFMELWNTQHQGVGNAHKTSVLGGGGAYNAVGINPVDAQFVESVGLMVSDVARIYGIPASRLDANYRAPVNPADDERYWETVDTYMRLIEGGLRSDLDLFPPSSLLEPKFNFDSLLRIAPSQQAAIINTYRQNGILSINEVREILGRPPIDPAVGDVYHPIPAGAGSDGASLDSNPPKSDAVDETAPTE